MITKLISYVKKRLNQRSFYVGMSLAVSAAAVLPEPWSYISFAFGSLGSLVLDGNIKASE